MGSARKFNVFLKGLARAGEEICAIIRSSSDDLCIIAFQSWPSGLEDCADLEEWANLEHSASFDP